MSLPLLFIACARGGALPYTTTSASPTVGGGVTDAVIVLDVGPTHAAIKVVQHRPGAQEMQPYDCGYAGMKEHPLSGVLLAVVDLATGETETFEVYARASTREECTPHDTSERVLAVAKERIAAVGLDLAARPAGIAAMDGTFIIEGVTFTTHQSMTDDGILHGMAHGELRRGEAVLVRAAHEFDLSMAGQGQITWQRAFPTEAGLVFLQVFSRFSGVSGTWMTHYSFTPPLPALP